MKKSLAVLAVVAALGPSVSAAGDHLVAPAEARAALAAAAGERTRHLALLERTLATPAAEQAAARLGLSASVLREALPSLSDSELAELTARAAALEADPAAGLSHDVEQLLIIFLIVAIVLLVLKAV